jgi:hypothetical protein
MSALVYIVIAVAIIALGYYKRHGFRRAWYILKTDAQKPDWESLGADYFLSRRELQNLRAKRDAARAVGTRPYVE